MIEPPQLSLAFFALHVLSTVDMLRTPQRERWLDLMPGGQDHWWWLRPGQPLEPLAVAVTGAFLDYSLPALRRAVRQAS
jgi:hypothetical protein